METVHIPKQPSARSCRESYRALSLGSDKMLHVSFTLNTFNKHGQLHAPEGQGLNETDKLLEETRPKQTTTTKV